MRSDAKCIIQNHFTTVLIFTYSYVLGIWFFMPKHNKIRNMKNKKTNVFVQFKNYITHRVDTVEMYKYV